MKNVLLNDEEIKLLSRLLASHIIDIDVSIKYTEDTIKEKKDDKAYVETYLKLNEKRKSHIIKTKELKEKLDKNLKK